MFFLGTSYQPPNNDILYILKSCENVELAIQFESTYPGYIAGNGLLNWTLDWTTYTELDYWTDKLLILHMLWLV